MKKKNPMAQSRAHDRGGWKTDEPIDIGEHATMDWEWETYGLAISLVKKGITNSGESRIPMERMSRAEYESLGYFERTVTSLETLLIEKKVLTKKDVDKKLAKMKRQQKR